MRLRSVPHDRAGLTMRRNVDESSLPLAFSSKYSGSGGIFSLKDEKDFISEIKQQN